MRTRAEIRADLDTLQTLAALLADCGIDSEEDNDNLEDTLSLICDRLTALALSSKEN